MMEQFLTSLASMSAAGSVVLAVVALVCHLGRRRLSPQCQFWLWFAVLARFLIPFPLAEGVLGQMTWHPSSSVTPSAATVPAAAQQAVIPVEASTALHSSLAPDWPQVLVLGWLAGAGAVLVWTLSRHHSWICKIQEQAVPAADIATLAELSSCAAELGVRPPDLWICGPAVGPLLEGIVRPRIYVPSGLAGRGCGTCFCMSWNICGGGT